MIRKVDFEHFQISFLKMKEKTEMISHSSFVTYKIRGTFYINLLLEYYSSIEAIDINLTGRLMTDQLLKMGKFYYKNTLPYIVSC